MTYLTGTYGAAAGNAALFITTTLHNALIAEGYVFVEQVVPAAGDTIRVYQNPAANNGSGFDFYLTVGRRDSNTTTIYFCSHLLWNTGTKTISRAVPVLSGSVSQSIDANGFWTPTATNPIVTGGMSSQVPIGDAAFTYYMHVDNEKLILSAGNSSSLTLYAGLYEPYHSTPTAPPVFSGAVAQGTGPQGVVWTPTITSAMSVTGALQVTCGTVDDQYTSASTIDYVSGKVIIAQIYLRHRAATPHHGCFGRFKDLGWGAFVGALPGDIVDTPTQDWTAMYSGDAVTFLGQ